MRAEQTLHVQRIGNRPPLAVLSKMHQVSTPFGTSIRRSVREASRSSPYAE